MAFGFAVYASQRRLPDPTQDSLPVAGQALLDGIHTRKVPMKGFKVVNYISFSFPKLAKLSGVSTRRAEVNPGFLRGGSHRRDSPPRHITPMSGSHVPKVHRTKAPTQFREWRSNLAECG